MSEIEAESRLRSVRDILDHEGLALAALDDRHLDHVLQATKELQEAIAIALATLGQPRTNSHRADARTSTNR